MSDLSLDELVAKPSLVPVHLAAAHCFQWWSRAFADCLLHLVVHPPHDCLWLWVQGAVLAAHLPARCPVPFCPFPAGPGDCLSSLHPYFSVRCAAGGLRIREGESEMVEQEAGMRMVCFLASALAACDSHGVGCTLGGQGRWLLAIWGSLALAKLALGQQ